MNIRVQVFVWMHFSWVYSNGWDCWVLWLPPSSFAYTSILRRGIYPTSDHRSSCSATLWASFILNTLPNLVLVCVCVCVQSYTVMFDSLQPQELQLTRILCPGDSPGKNTRVGCHALLQGIFPTQRLNLHLRISRTAGRFFSTESPGKTNLAPRKH